MKDNELVQTKLLKSCEKAGRLGTKKNWWKSMDRPVTSQKETPNIFNGRIQSPQDGTK
jgi:hypothetical protein